MEFERAIIKQMLSEEIIIANSLLRDRRPHTSCSSTHKGIDETGFTLLEHVLTTPLVSVKLIVTNNENSGHTKEHFMPSFPGSVSLNLFSLNKTQASTHSRPLQSSLQAPQAGNGERI